MQLNPQQRMWAQTAFNLAQTANHPDPYGFAAKIMAESGFNPQARSSAGALGIAQFMPDTAKEYGIDPLDPMQALKASIRYDMTYFDASKGAQAAPLMYAAYNAGPGRAARALNQFKETQDYIHRINTLRPEMERMLVGSTWEDPTGQEYGVNRADAMARVDPAHVAPATTAAAQQGLLAGGGSGGGAPTQGEVQETVRVAQDNATARDLAAPGLPAEAPRALPGNSATDIGLFVAGTMLDYWAKDKHAQNKGNRGGSTVAGMAPGRPTPDPFITSANYRPIKSILGGNYHLQ